MLGGVMRRKFNPEMRDYLKKHGKEHILKEWVNILNDRYNENFTLKNIQQYFFRHSIEYKAENPKRHNNNIFKRPIGAERVRKDGMVQVKVAHNKWDFKQRVIYEQFYGVKLTSDDYIIFLDQDRTNFDISNLKRVSRHESSILSNQKIFSKDPNVTELGIDVAKAIIKTKDYESCYKETERKDKIWKLSR